MPGTYIVNVYDDSVVDLPFSNGIISVFKFDGGLALFAVNYTGAMLKRCIKWNNIWGEWF